MKKYCIVKFLCLNTFAIWSVNVFVSSGFLTIVGGILCFLAVVVTVSEYDGSFTAKLFNIPCGLLVVILSVNCCGGCLAL